MSVGIFNYLETSDSSKVFKYTVDVFADLATLTDVEDLDLAFVSTTTGILGFRNLKGLYQYKGTTWVYATKDLQDLAIAQQAEIDNNEQAITDLENTKVDSVTGDGVDNTDPLNPVLSFESAASIKTKYESNADTNAFTDSEKTNLGNQSGTNTGDETTATIQSKRPLKTVNSQTLEGSGNITISGTVEPLPICVLSSTNSGLTATQSTPAIFPWNVETEKDTGFTHSNSTNNTRLTVVADGTYQIQANIRMFSSQQRAQFVGRYLIDGVIQSMPLGSSYIRNNGTSSDFGLV